MPSKRETAVRGKPGDLFRQAGGKRTVRLAERTFLQASFSGLTAMSAAPRTQNGVKGVDQQHIVTPRH
jgi:hypothetical protein